MKRDWKRGLTAKSLFGALSLVSATAVMAQEEQVVETVKQSASIVVSSDQEGGEQEGIVVISAENMEGGGPPMVSGFSFNSADGNVFAIGGDEMGGGLFGGTGGPINFRMGAELPMMGAANNWSSLLNIPEVRKELDIMDAQMEQITKARTEMEKGIKDQVSKIMEGGFDPSKAKEMAEMIRAQRSAVEDQINEQLLPAQVQRLKEVALRMQMKQVGTVGMLGRKDIKEALGLSDDQVKALEQKAEELDKEMKKRVEELKKKAQAELLNELNPDQRKKLDEMLGKEFDYQAPERPRMIRTPGLVPGVAPTAPAIPAAPAPPRGPEAGVGTTRGLLLKSGGR